ncbi:MAG: NUDIX domain-containing protein [Chloroflexota bacterium]|nr:NUDIX domain-containing protein [Chloroflexota bacterium]
MERHFTVSGFLVEHGRTALHWHRKLQIWLPPGGHIDPDEDMVQAVVREVREETGIAAEIVPHVELPAFSNLPQLPPPLAIIVADVPDGPHQHIDMSYALRPVAGAPRMPPEEGHEFVWVSEAELRSNDLLLVASCGVDIPIAEDVRVIALQAIALVQEKSV